LTTGLGFGAVFNPLFVAFFKYAECDIGDNGEITPRTQKVLSSRTGGYRLTVAAGSHQAGVWWSGIEWRIVMVSLSTILDQEADDFLPLSDFRVSADRCSQLEEHGQGLGQAEERHTAGGLIESRLRVEFRAGELVLR